MTKLWTEYNFYFSKKKVRYPNNVKLMVLMVLMVLIVLILLFGAISTKQSGGGPADAVGAILVVAFTELFMASSEPPTRCASSGKLKS